MPNIVSISEDASRVIGRVDYDTETDCCVGFVLPVDQHGLPLIDSFTATSFSAIESMFQKNAISKYAVVYVAQPLSSNAPPFVLACLGTDNKFTAKHVLQRWNYLYHECAKQGITVLNFSGDGDSRIMKSIRVSTSLMTDTVDPDLPLFSPAISVPKSWNIWYCTMPKRVLFVQVQFIYVAVKLKARLLNPNVTLKLGPKFEAGGYHIEMLRSKLGKEEHFLRQKDVDHKDRQNFDAVLHIMKAAPLLDQINGSAATKCYLEIMQSITNSYLDKTLNPLERIEKIWYANFFVHYWRQWILLHP